MGSLLVRRRRTARRDAGAVADQINERLAKARGICAVAGAVPGHEAEIPDVALPDALLAVRDMLDETESLVLKLAALAGQKARASHG